MLRINEPRSKMRKRHISGFTFLEIMVVVVILLLLATIVIVNYVGRVEQAKKDKTEMQIKEIEKALELYRLDNGNYPTTEQGLKALVEKPESEPVPKKWKKILNEVPKDSWDNEFIYVCPGEHRDYDLSSKGPDATEGTEDDIINWKREKEKEKE